MRDDHFVGSNFPVVKGVHWRQGFAIFDQDPRQGRPRTFFSFPALTLTVCREFQTVGVARHISVVLLEPCVAHQLVIQHSPGRVLAGLGWREDCDDVGDFAPIERRVDVPLQVVNGLSLGGAISGVKDLKGAPKVTSNAAI